MEKKKDEKEAYVTVDSTNTSVDQQENMAKKSIKKFKSLN